MMKKISILLVLLLTQITFAQKAQKVGYIDREYILENVPEYKTAQSKLDSKISKWNVSLNKLKSEIESLKLTLVNEKALLTPDLIKEREEDILIKETELRTQQDNYFGTSGDLFMLRKQLVKPVQDQIFNAIQEIAKNKKYDIILDKSSDDLVMLYTNPKYDISELVLQKIVKGRKKKENAKKKSDNELAREKKKEAIKTKADDRRTKQEKLRDKIKKQNEAKAAKREAFKKANAEKRAKKIADAQARREAAKNKGKKKSSSDKKSDDIGKEKAPDKSVAEIKAEQRAEKQKALKERAAANKAKKDSLRKVAVDKRAKKIADAQARRDALKNKGKKAPTASEDKSNPISIKEKDEDKEVLEKKEGDEVKEVSKVLTKEEQKEVKRNNLIKRANAKKVKRDSLRKVAADKRAKKLADIKERKIKLEESKNKNKNN